MTKTVTFVAAALLVTNVGAAYAQSENRIAEGVVNPYSVRNLPNGERAPAPVNRANGGVGATEVPYDNAQTRSGGPVGGSVTDTGG